MVGSDSTSLFFFGGGCTGNVGPQQFLFCLACHSLVAK